MTIQDLTKHAEFRLTDALTSFDWATSASIVGELVEVIRHDPGLFPEALAKRLLSKLRSKRQFTLMASLADALISSGQRSLQIRRQYAQALIDQGILAAAESLLQSVIQDSRGHNEEKEARGLIGRIYKQMYVNIGDSKSTRNRANLEKALAEYLSVYRLDKRENTWHGINAVALLERAKRDQIPLQGLSEAAKLAEEILTTLRTREEQATELIPAWDVATSMEALVALGFQSETHTRVEGYLAELEAKALEYAYHAQADAFEIASTLRQLTEVWQLNDSEPPGSIILPLLRAALLRRRGGVLCRSPEDIQREIKVVGNAQAHLEKVFGPDRTLTLAWYRQGLKRCESVARVERLNGKGHGTGWLVNSAEFFPGREGRLLLLTNAHVISKTPFPNALEPHQAKINFQVTGKVYDVDEVIWSSPPDPDHLDATFVSLKGDQPVAEPLPLYPGKITAPPPQTAPPRLYIIGYPGGRDLEFSLQDNHLVATNERVLHYRTPTEPGSSGSPVFEQDGWNVVALHHAGKNQMGRIDVQPGTYEANEGIVISAIRNATSS